VTWGVAGCVSLTVVLGSALLWLFFYGVVLPVRAMVADARGLARQVSPDQELATDEFQAVGIYLRNLMSDVADTRTTLERSRLELKVAEKLASVGRLAASIAHEIRNPLTSLKMWLFSIQKEIDGSPDLNRKFEIVSSEIRRLENIVQNFLEFSRFPELRFSAESVTAILDQTFELMAPRLRAHRIDLCRQDAPELPPIQADPEQLKQVLLNLLNNAIEAMGQDGQIRVSSSAKPDPNGRSMVVVQIADRGPGIPDDVARRIFEPFFSTKENGTGLGLSVAARIIAGHDGRLVLESSNSHGSVFSIYIPAGSVTKT
jgi:signal transduction histidine kinase